LFGAECTEAVQSILADLRTDALPLFAQGCTEPPLAGCALVDPLWASLSKAPVPRSERAGVGYNDACMYIFTCVVCLPSWPV